MSPLAIVGQLMLISLLHLVTSDVTHVLENASGPNTNAEEINSLVHASTVKRSPKQNDFWWQNDDSPLKKAFDEFKDCKSKDGCARSHAHAVSVSNGVEAAGSSSVKIDLSKNPFLNGEKLSGEASFVQPKIDLSKNPFFSGHGKVIQDNGEGFLGVQPAEIKFAKSKPLSLTHPLSSGDCTGDGLICVPIAKCQNGLTVAGYADGLLQAGNKVRLSRLVLFLFCYSLKPFLLSLNEHLLISLRTKPRALESIT